MHFNLQSPYKPAGDQPQAIQSLVEGLNSGLKKQTLLGVTGSGKTFTMANVIAQTNRPALVIAHNKTLAAQLCNEFREFFPENVVEYFVSYYDYYQPEAYIARSDTYIEKEAMVNEEIDRLRHKATQALLSRRDVIIVASVSCIYGVGSPDEYEKHVLRLNVNDTVDRNELIRRLIGLYFERTTADVDRGLFRALGDVIEVMPKSENTFLYRIILDGDRVSEIFMLDPITRKILESVPDMWLFPAKHYVVGGEQTKRALVSIEAELKDRLAELDLEGKVLESARLKQRTRYDLEMIRNVGYCNGIENYSRHFEGRAAGEPASTLLSFFPDDFLTIIDESHVTVSQIGGMYAGDRSRKDTLVEHGFRLPSAVDNRPLQFPEFEKKTGQTVYVSATPGKYELEHSDRVVEQIVRPTGLIDPETIVLPVTETLDFPGQVDDLLVRIQDRVKKQERVLVTTLTKKMAEDLSEYLAGLKIKVNYLHSDIKTLERIEVLTDLRKGVYDVVVGVNLLREGLDLPEVSLVAILDADKEGFLRSETSLVQTIGRAARHINGQVVLYADVMTGSLKRALDETDRRRKIQVAYNKKHNITPQGVQRNIKDIRAVLGGDGKPGDISDVLKIELTASPKELAEIIKEKEREMKYAAAEMNFETAAILRDEIVELDKELKKGRKRSKSSKGSDSSLR